MALSVCRDVSPCCSACSLPALLCCATQPTNKYFVDLLKEEWAVVVNKPTGKAQVITHKSGCQCNLPKQLAGHNHCDMMCATQAAVTQA